jgi:hypothetical protein
MNKEQFVETYCRNCGTQRCEGIDSEWFDGCRLKWNLDGMDPAAEIERLDSLSLDLAAKIMNNTKQGKLTFTCVREGQMFYKCSECWHAFPWKTMNYCPNCGTKFNQEEA